MVDLISSDIKSDRNGKWGSRNQLLCWRRKENKQITLARPSSTCINLPATRSIDFFFCFFYANVDSHGKRTWNRQVGEWQTSRRSAQGASSSSLTISERTHLVTNRKAICCTFYRFFSFSLRRKIIQSVLLSLCFLIIQRWLLCGRLMIHRVVNCGNAVLLSLILINYFSSSRSSEHKARKSHWNFYFVA